jgi:TPR repeat protein
MKKMLLPVMVSTFLLAQGRLFAQQPVSSSGMQAAQPAAQTYASVTAPGDAQLHEGLRYLNGTAAYDPARAIAPLMQSAAAGNTRAMNALGNIAANGLTGPANGDLAVSWYQKALKAGYMPANYNLGRLYQTGDIVPQDFVRAAGYFQAGVAAGDKASKNSLAYFYYKGLGVQQDYAAALALYSELAPEGDVNAQYFLGLMYRNGYGTAPNQALAKQWLMKAAAAKDGQAIHELTAEPVPENASVISDALQNKLTTLKGYQEQFTSSASNDIGGEYEGYAVYYDFSHQFVHDIVPLKLSLLKKGDSYQGTWTEGEGLSASLKASFDNNTLQFDSTSQYTRSNYYSYRTPEPYRFDQASISMKFVGDSAYLSGDVKFYSIRRKEPGQPMYIALTRRSQWAGSPLAADFKLALSPNPVISDVRVGFTISNSAKVELQLVDQHGNIMKQTTPETLPAGTYNYTLNTDGLAAGSYFLKFSAGNQLQSKSFIKL